MTAALPVPIPVTLIGGFLGAGKTTLLNHILSEQHGVRAAVLVNDFGAINIDAKLVVGVDGDTVELANGCVCCTIRDDLAGACLGLLRRPERPEYLFVELSGVTDPVPVINTLHETELSAVFAFNSILSVVDAEQLPELMGVMAKLARAQLCAADIVVVNKVDLVTTDQLDRVKQLVHHVTPGARIVETIRGRVPLQLVFVADGASSRVEDRDFSRAGHGQRPNGHQMASWSSTHDRPLSLPGLRSVLESLPDSIYRCKGIVWLEELPGYRYVLQMVGRRYTIEETGTWGSDEPRSEIVVIGGSAGIDDDSLRAAFDSCVGAGDEARSPVMRLVRKLAPELLAEPEPLPPLREPVAESSGS